MPEPTWRLAINCRGGRGGGEKRRVVSGVDMGNAAAGLLFMINIDPLVVVIDTLPGIDRVMAYMDDVAATANLLGCWWFQQAIQAYRFAGPLIWAQHRCWSTSAAVGNSYADVVRTHPGADAVYYVAATRPQ